MTISSLDAMLEVAIGLVFAWLILSMANMQLQEWLGTILSWRARFLEAAILNMLRDKDLVEKFYNHPLIQSLRQPGKKKYDLPSYIPSQKFAAAALDVLLSIDQKGSEPPPPASTLSLTEIRERIQTLKAQEPRLAQALDHLFPNLDEKTTDAALALETARANIESWFNDSMERLSDWYRQHAHTWAFILGLGLAFALNVDSVQIAQDLWREPTLRQTLVAQAQNQNVPAESISVSELKSEYENLSIPIGWGTIPAENNEACGWLPGQPVHPAVWSNGECRILVNLPMMDDGWGWLVKFIGLLISGAAAAQGSPFWFDILKKLINVRGSTPAPAPAPPPPAEPVG
jgi:hypothetical protein